MAIYTGTDRGETIRGDRNAPGEIDVIYGLGGNDVILGYAGRDRLYGGDGNDDIYAQDADQIRGGAGDDAVFYTGLIAGYADGGAGRRDGLVFDHALFDRRSGSVRFDNFEHIDSGSLTGTDGADRLDLSSITATTNLGGYSTTLTIRGGGGADAITGGAERDVIYGGAGADTIDGGAGRDVLYADGADMLRGGTGDDIVVYEGVIVAGTADGGLNGNDLLVFEDALFGRSSGSSRFDNFERIDSGSLTGTDGADRLDLSSITATTNLGGYSTTLTIRGGGGADAITGGAERDVIYGGAGADTIDGGAGRDVLYADGADMLRGGTGDDIVVYEGVIVAGTADGGLNGNDLLVFEDALFGRSSGSSRFDNFERIDSGSLTGTDGADRLDLSSITATTNLGGYSTTLTIRGGGGADAITGGAERDVIYGEAGADTIDGGGGRDVLVGGAGADRFRFAAGGLTAAATTTDTIADFNQAERDRIDLSAIDGNSATPAIDPLRFIGSAAFSGSARELRYQFSGSDTLLNGDTDGDGDADFVLRLTGEIALTRGDILVRQIETIPAHRDFAGPHSFQDRFEASVGVAPEFLA